jgi:hypothetical protein
MKLIAIHQNHNKDVKKPTLKNIYLSDFKSRYTPPRAKRVSSSL